MYSCIKKPRPGRYAWTGRKDRDYPADLDFQLILFWASRTALMASGLSINRRKTIADCIFWSKSSILSNFNAKPASSALHYNLLHDIVTDCRKNSFSAGVGYYAEPNNHNVERDANDAHPGRFFVWFGEDVIRRHSRSYTWCPSVADKPRGFFYFWNHYWGYYPWMSI